MISDYVKGKRKYDYPLGIQKGIMLHRFIDTFTDQHAATKEAKEIFRPVYRLYSGAFVDVIYDHFLAADEQEFSEKSLLAFTEQVYRDLDNQKEWFQEKFAHLFPYMKQHNWLYNYRYKWGIEKSMGGVVRRAVYLHESNIAFSLFNQHYQLLQECYRHFWTDVKIFARTEFDILLSNPA